MKLVYGVGINDVPGLVTTKEYRLWIDMLKRCYNKALHEKLPTYSDCNVSDHFKKFSRFLEWCSHQTGFNQDGFELDKDLLSKGNKEYHPDKCVFIPKEINSSLRTRKKMRGNLPIGVCKVKNGGFRAQVNNGVEKKYLGSFKTPEQAFQVYKQAKENHIKLLAQKYRDQIDPRAYEALLNYRVEITD